MKRIEAKPWPYRESEPTSDWCLFVREIEELIKQRNLQMTTLVKGVGAPSTRDWNWESIDWKTVWYRVNKLQLRIAKAIRLGRHNKAKALQWLLTHSFYAKLLAVKRVTQNRGKYTPGVDQIVWRTPRQKMSAVKMLKRRGYHSQPLRRIHIPKKNGKLRPLGIPTMIDRSQQALHLLALDPIAETQADRNSYGFRQRRSAHDAIEQCFKALAKKQSAQWILEGDIKSCFDEISSEWLLSHVTMDKHILKQWLEAGFIEKGTFHHTTRGTAQGGVISPTTANIALDGFEEAIKRISAPGDKLNFVRYADDWICTAASEEILKQKVLPTAIKFLEERGLEISKEKTIITHIDEGFDFLGFNIRKYNNKLLIKPSKRGVKVFLNNIRAVIHKRRADKTEALIKTLNPKIKGWVNYYRHSVAKQTFSYIDANIFRMLWKWAKRRHPNKGAKWVKNKYFTRQGQRNWCFFSKIKGKKNDIILLNSAAKTRIKRHVKIRAEATPYDPKFKEYFYERSLRLKKKNETQ